MKWEKIIFGKTLNLEVVRNIAPFQKNVAEKGYNISVAPLDDPRIKDEPDRYSYLKDIPKDEQCWICYPASVQTAYNEEHHIKLNGDTELMFEQDGETYYTFLGSYKWLN